MMDGSLLQVILPLVAGLEERLQAGIDVADIGCGSGHALNLMAQAFPRSRFAGYDFSQEGIAAAQAEAKQMGLTNTRFEARDVSRLDIPDHYDFITAFDSIHDQARPAEVLKVIEKALRPGGVFLMLDIRASSHGLTLGADDERPTRRTALRQVIHLLGAVPLLDNGLHHLRNDVAGAPHDHPISDTDVLALDVLLVM